MDIQTELRQLELMDPRHDNIYARILDGWQRAIDEAVESALEAASYQELDSYKAEIETMGEEIDSLYDELKAKNAEIDRLVVEVDALETELRSINSRGYVL